MTNSKHDPTFANQWWQQTRNWKGTILTKPELKKQLEQRIIDLEQGKKGTAFKDLETELKQKQTELDELVEFMKKELGFVDYTDGRNQLQGQTVPQLLTKLAEKENFINQQNAELVQKDNELNLLNQLAKENLNQLEKEKQEIKQSFIQKKKHGTTHWIYWKKWAEEQIASYKITNSKLIEDYNQKEKEFQDWKNILGDFLTEHKATNLGEITTKLKDLGTDNQTKQVKISQQEKQRKDGKKAFEEIVKLVNKKKTFIFGDLQKKKIKGEMGKLKTIFGWNEVDTEAESEEN